MFKNHDVVTDEQVGDYIKELHEEAEQEMREELGELDETLERTSSRTPRWKNSKKGLSSVR